MTSQKATSGLPPDLPKETWEYLELKLWNSFSKKIWLLVTSVFTLLGLLAALGFNSLVQVKLDDTIKTDKNVLEAYIKTTQTKTDTILALQVIHFHLYNRLTSDIRAYIVSANKLESELQTDKGTTIKDFMPQVNTLLGPIKENGDFESLPKDDFQRISQLGHPPSHDDIMFALYKLAIWNGHIIALRETLKETEKLMFGAIKYDPKQMAQIYEDDIYPTYVSAMRAYGLQTPLWGAKGLNTIDSLTPDAGTEFRFYIKNPWDQLFKPKTSP